MLQDFKMRALEPRWWSGQSWRESFNQSYNENIATGDSVCPSCQDRLEERKVLSQHTEASVGTPVLPSTHPIGLNYCSYLRCYLDLGHYHRFPGRSLPYCKLHCLLECHSLCLHSCPLEQSSHSKREVFFKCLSLSKTLLLAHAQSKN